jgi:hypothetical protein
MGSQLLIAAMAAGIGFSPLPAHDGRLIMVGGDCSAAAQRVVSQTGGQLLSAQPSGDTCVITVLVPSDGGRPRKVTVRVPM